MEVETKIINRSDDIRRVSTLAPTSVVITIYNFGLLGIELSYHIPKRRTIFGLLS